MLENKENIDYLAEFVVSYLLESKGIDDKKVYMHYQGIFKRFFSRDVEKTEIHKNSLGEKEFHIYLNREGLYDLLPEGFFHGHSAKYFKDRLETIAEFRQRKKEEKNARQFFIPLEQEFFQYWLNKELFEQNYFYAPETIQEFIEFFGLNNLSLSMYQKASLFYILPYISKIAGNLELTQACFEIILQEHVQIRKCYEVLKEETGIKLPELNNCSLGVNSLLGNTCIDNNLQLIIEVGPLSDSNKLLSYLQGEQRKLIDRLIELFIQADLTTHVTILLNKQDEPFILGEQEYESRLNYSTTI